MAFKFELNQEATIIVSQETGVIVARIDYSASESQYQLRYKNNTGTAEEKWWPESSISSN